jgi:hypothetical protein
LGATPVVRAPCPPDAEVRVRTANTAGAAGNAGRPLTMAEKVFLGDRRRKEEEEYFRRQEQLLIDKLRQRPREEAARRDMPERTGVADEEILRDSTRSLTRPIRSCFSIWCPSSR